MTETPIVHLRAPSGSGSLWYCAHLGYPVQEGGNQRHSELAEEVNCPDCRAHMPPSPKAKKGPSPTPDRPVLKVELGDDYMKLMTDMVQAFTLKRPSRRPDSEVWMAAFTACTELPGNEDDPQTCLQTCIDWADSAVVAFNERFPPNE